MDSDTVQYIQFRFVYKHDLLFKDRRVVLNRKMVYGIYYSVAELVYIFHHGMIPEGLKVIHINGSKYNNKISNLDLAIIKPKKTRTVYQYLVHPQIEFKRKFYAIQDSYKLHKLVTAEKKENKRLLLIKQKALQVKRVNFLGITPETIDVELVVPKIAPNLQNHIVHNQRISIIGIDGKPQRVKKADQKLLKKSNDMKQMKIVENTEMFSVIK
jgi:hypothetical protein